MFSTFVIKILIIAVTKEFLKILLKSLKLLQFIKKRAQEKNNHRPNTEAALKRCSKEKMFWKNPANVQESTHAKV